MNLCWNLSLKYVSGAPGLMTVSHVFFIAMLKTEIITWVKNPNSQEDWPESYLHHHGWWHRGLELGTSQHCIHWRATGGEGGVCVMKCNVVSMAGGLRCISPLESFLYW